MRPPPTTRSDSTTAPPARSRRPARLRLHRDVLDQADRRRQPDRSGDLDKQSGSRRGSSGDSDTRGDRHGRPGCEAASQITIKGLGFDPTAANNTVTFNDGAAGTVTTASPTSLTVTFSTKPTTAGSLTAIVATDKAARRGSSCDGDARGDRQHGRPGREPHRRSRSRAWASIRPPPITRSPSTTAPSARSASAAPTALVVTFSTRPTTAGKLTAVVTTDKQSSGAAVQAATVTPAVTASTAQLPASRDPGSRSMAWASMRRPPITRSRSTTAPPAPSRRRAQPR